MVDPPDISACGPLHSAIFCPVESYLAGKKVEEPTLVQDKFLKMQLGQQPALGDDLVGTSPPLQAPVHKHYNRVKIIPKVLKP